MANNVLPDPLNVNVVSPDPLPVEVGNTVDVNIVTPNPMPVDLVSSVTVDVNVVSPDPLPVSISSPDPLPVSGRTAWRLEARAGRIPGVSLVDIFGRNPDIDSGSGFEDIWNGGGEYTGLNAVAAETVSVVSSSADDNAAGIGAITMRLDGLDASYNEISEEITLTGTTPVITLQSFIRCSFSVVLTAGSNREPVGNITATQSITTANVFFIMPLGSNRTMVASYTVPAGKTAYIDNTFATLAKKGTASSEIKGRVRALGGVFQTAEWFAINSTGSSYVYRDFENLSRAIPEKSDVVFSADSSTNDVGIAAGFTMIIEDNV